MKKQTQHNVVMCAGTIKYVLDTFNTEREAIKMCETHNWEFQDYNAFVWDLEISEVQA